MKHKIFTALSVFALTMVFSVAAYATEPPKETPEPETYDVWVGGVQVTEENKDNILNAENEADYVTYDPMTSTLTAHTLQIKGANGYGIKALGDLIINVPDDYLRVRNTTVTETGESYGIYCTGSLTLQGDNIIYFVSGEATAKSIGLYCAGDLKLDKYTYVRGTSGVVNNADGDAVSAGVWTDGKIIATDTNEVFGVGNKVMNGTSYGIFSGSDMYLNNSNAHGEVNGYDAAYEGAQQTYGIYVCGDICAENGSDISALAGWGSSDNYCVYAKGNIKLESLSKISATLDGDDEALTLGGIRSDKDLTVDYSILKVAADDTKVRNSYGLDVKNLTIKNNSHCTVSSQPAVADSIAILVNNNLSFSSGIVNATAAEAGENSIAVDLSLLEGSNGVNQISGGTLIAQSAGVAIKSCHSSLLILGGNITAIADECAIRAKAGLNISGKEDFDGGFIGPRLSLTSTSGKVIDASHAILGDSDHPALLENAANEDGLLISSGSGEFDTNPLYADDKEAPVTISFDDDLVCCYKEKIKLGEDSNVLMTLGGKEAGYFSFRKEGKGWVIIQSSKPGMLGMSRTPYLAAEDGKLVYSDEPFVWKYNGSSFYTSEKKLMPARNRLLSLIYGDRYRTVTYYLSTTTSNANLSSHSVRTAFYTEHEGEEHVYKANKKGQHVCVNCGRVEDCQYNALTHECICGKYDPEKAVISLWFNYDLVKKEIHHKEVDVYSIDIKTYATGIEVERVEYRINGEKRWRKGTKVESFSEIKSIEARALGSNGKWYTASAQEP